MILDCIVSEEILSFPQEKQNSDDCFKEPHLHLIDYLV